MAHCQCFFPTGIMQISLSYHRSFELFPVFSVALLLLCRGTWLIELLILEKLGLRPPLFCVKRHSRGTLWYDLCYRRTVVVDIYVISYECISVCSMPIAVIGNALTIVSFCDQPICCFFAPFEACTMKKYFKDVSCEFDEYLPGNYPYPGLL